MIKKITYIFIPLFLILIILFIGYRSYNKATQNTTDPINIIPTNASVILRLNDTKSIYNELNSKNIWNNLLSINIIDSINKKINNISEIFQKNDKIFKNQTLFISLHKIGTDNTGILFSSNFKNQKENAKLALSGLLGNSMVETIYNNQPIFKIKNKDHTIYASFKDDIIFCSDAKMLIEDAIRTSYSEEKLINKTSFKDIYNTISKSTTINMLINYNSLFKYLNIFSEKPINHFNFSEWTATDLHIKNDLITANGFSSFDNNNFTYSLYNQKPEKIKIIKIIPNSTSLLLNIGFDNAKEIYNKKNKLLQKSNNLWSWNKHRKEIKDNYNIDYNDFINETENEAGTFSTSLTKSEEQKYTFFKSKNPVIAISLMQGLIINSQEYSEYSINQIKESNLTGQLFGYLFNNDNSYFTIINDYLIFGKSISSIKYIIDNYKRGNTLSNNKYFNHYSNYLSKTSNFLFYINPYKTTQSIIQKLKQPYKEYITINPDSISKITSFSIQMNSKKNLLLNNINLVYDKKFKETIKEEWLKELESKINMSPQFVYNHATKKEVIIIQNNKNNICAINDLGEKLWSVQLDTPIIGNISIADVYKNNKFQYLFNTNKQIHLIDRNGSNVEGFPITLKTYTKLGHSLFDYKKNKKYRIMIVGEDNNIYNIDKKGNKVKGWKYKKDNNIITNKPRYFNIKDRDYILAERSNSGSKLLAINGSDRVKFDKDVLFNNNPIQIDEQGTLYAITNEGKLWRGFIDGNTSTISIPNLTNESLLIYFKENSDSINSKKEENTLIYTTNNTLYIISLKDFQPIKTINIDQQILKIKIINNLLCVTTKNKLYIYNKHILVDGFPIDSEGNFNISDIDNDGKLNLIDAKNGFIYNYELSVK